MCLEIVNPFNRFTRTTKKDIKVYKVLRVEKHNFESGPVVRYYAPYRTFLYNMNLPYTSRLGVKGRFRSTMEVNEGFHSFVTYEDALHELRDFRRSFRETKFDVFECIIPAGSKYYKGVFSERPFPQNYASDKIIVVNRCYN